LEENLIAELLVSEVGCTGLANADSGSAAAILLVDSATACTNGHITGGMQAVIGTCKLAEAGFIS
jgi:hypothetical protein